MIGCVIFAAGKGKRMKGAMAKVLYSLMGKPMLEYILEATSFCEKRVVVVGRKADEVTSLIGKRAEIVVQKEQLGTADALICAMPWTKNLSDILVLPADVPLIKADTLKSLINAHQKKESLCTLLSVRKKNPEGYGRIIINERVRIVEEKDAKPSERKENLVNTGIYCFKKEGLWKKLKAIGSKNKQQEYYLTDVVEMFEKERVLVVEHKEEMEVSGINDRLELSKQEELFKKEILCRLMKNGVSIKDPSSTYIEQEVEIEQDTTIFPNTFILGKTKIGKNCIIGPSTWIKETKIGKNTQILFSHVEESIIKDNCKIGPFSHIRAGCLICEEAKIGNFVEVKKSRIGKEAKANHLSYLGDTNVGEAANIGAGTITCNFDGLKKHPTEIGDFAFIGSNTSLVAPVKIGKSATIGAGSVITSDVPDCALAIERTQQKVIHNWAKRGD